jgi:hypothetical protein
MSLGTGLSLAILLCAIGMFVQSFRVAPEGRMQMRVLAFAFLLMGGSDFLKPLSPTLALGTDAVGVLILVGWAIRSFVFGDPAKAKG